MKFLAGILLAVSTFTASAQSSYTYDWQSGNSYQTYQDPYTGKTTVHGTNLNTGSMWNTTIDQQGNMRGTDKNLNTWTYDAQSGNYMNYGTGKFCTGNGYARICN